MTGMTTDYASGRCYSTSVASVVLPRLVTRPCWSGDHIESLVV